MVACAQKQQMKQTTAKTERAERAERPERAESSFIFSLTELSRMEAERVRAEGDAAQAERDALIRAGHEADERVRREARRLHQEAEAQVRAAELQDRAQIARIEAEKLATVEAAKVAAEVRARAEAGVQQRTNDFELEKLRVTAGYAGKKRGLLGALAGALFVAGAALAVQVGILQPQFNQRLGEATVQAKARDAEIATVKSEITELAASSAAVRADLRTSQEANKKLADELTEARKTSSVQPHIVTTKPPVGGVTPVVAHPLPDTGDVVPPGFHRCPGGKSNGDPTCW